MNFFDSVPEWHFIALCVLFGTAHELNFPAGHVAHLSRLHLERVISLAAIGQDWMTFCGTMCSVDFLLDHMCHRWRVV